jgi:methionyl-tRNA formyltransferase
MVIKINKPVNTMKIGVTGTRAKCFANVLDKYNIPYRTIDVAEIDKTFDFVFESGLYTLISDEYLSMPRFGVIGIHESPLPEGKGHAPIQWAVLSGKRNLTVTLYKLDTGVDSGKIIHQVNMPILKIDTIVELNRKRLSGVEKVFDVFIKELLDGYIVLRSQTGRGSYHQRRNLDSCELNKEEKLCDLWDQIRICDNDLYPAWFKIGKKKVIIKYEVVDGV